MNVHDYAYVVTPALAWLVAGGCKFLINSLRAGKLAWRQIGYGGMPSNHSAIVSSMAGLIALREGVADPAFGVALTLAFIVIMDAVSLRRQIGRHAQTINQLTQNAPGIAMLRERMGHSRAEVIAGIGVGMAVACLVHTCLR